MSESESEIEAKPIIEKVKKPKTEKQIEAWNKALATRTANRQKRSEEKDTMYKEKLAKQEEKLVKREKKIELKVKKEITEKLLKSDDEEEYNPLGKRDEKLCSTLESGIEIPKVVKKKKTKVVYVDSDDEEIDNKAPIVIINKFEKKEKEVVKLPEPVKPKIRFL